MPSEQESVQAILNRLVREIDALHETISRKQALLESVTEIQREFSGGESIDNIPALSPAYGRPSMRNALRRWIKDSRRKEFRAIEVADYLAAHGFKNKNLYNSVFEALKRLVAKGELKKVGGRFSGDRKERRRGRGMTRTKFTEDKLSEAGRIARLSSVDSPVGTGIAFAQSTLVSPIGHRRTKNDRVILPIDIPGRAILSHRAGTDTRSSVDALKDQLTNDLQVLSDRLGKAHEILRDEIIFWERGLKEDKWESQEEAQRRLSRLKGALGYVGHQQGFYRKKVEPRK